MNLFDLLTEEHALAKHPINLYYRTLGQLTFLEIRNKIEDKFGTFKFNVYLDALHRCLTGFLPVTDEWGDYGVSKLIKDGKLYYFRYQTPTSSGPCFSFDMIPQDIKEMFE